MVRKALVICYAEVETLGNEGFYGRRKVRRI